MRIARYVLWEHINLALDLLISVAVSRARKESIKQDWDCFPSLTVPYVLQEHTQQASVPAQFPNAWFVAQDHFSQAVVQLIIVRCVMLEHISLDWV